MQELKRVQSARDAARAMKRPSAAAVAAAAAAVSSSVTAANKRGRTAGIAAVKASTQRGTAVINNGTGPSAGSGLQALMS